MWNDVRETLRETAASSKTEALHAAYEAHDVKLATLRARFTRPARSPGGAGARGRPIAASRDSRGTTRGHLTNDITMPDDAVGVALVAGDRLVSLDVFDRASTLRHCWDLLVDSFLIEHVARKTEGLEVDPQAACVLASEALDRVEGTKWATFPAVGAGRDLRFNGKDLVGSALATDDDCVVHLQVFGTDG